MQRIVERSGILQKAEKLVTDRDKEHGDAHKNFKMVADFGRWLRHKIYPHEVPT